MTGFDVTKPSCAFCTGLCKHERQRVQERSRVTPLRSDMQLAHGRAMLLIDGEKA